MFSVSFFFGWRSCSIKVVLRGFDLMNELINLYRTERARECLMTVSVWMAAWLAHVGGGGGEGGDGIVVVVVVPIGACADFHN